VNAGVREDSEALVREVYAEWGKALLAYVTGLTGDPHRAEDIVQEAMLRAWCHADRLRAESSPDALPDGTDGSWSMRAWLFKVARNIAIDESRARKARPLEVEERDDPSMAVQDGTEEVLTAIDVSRALRRLAPPQRAVMIEVYLRGRTITEAARSLRIPLGTAKSRLYDATRLLRCSPLRTAA
jgi:RNA polymerase sigma-70 factor (ECF subfamily)